MAFSLTPSVPPNIPEDRVYSINDFNNYFDQLQRIISEHDDRLASLVSGVAGYLPFKLNPETIDTELENGVYYITSSSVGGTVPEGVMKDNMFIMSVLSGATSTQFLFDIMGIYVRSSGTSSWKKVSGASVIDSLDSTDKTNSLSANQGRVLNEKKIDNYIHTSSSGAVDIDSLPQGVHTFVGAQVTGTLPGFASITDEANLFEIESYGLTDFVVFQRLTDAMTTLLGFRIGTMTEGAIEDYWSWGPWNQIATEVTLDQNLKDLEDKLKKYVDENFTENNSTIDCGTF